VAALRRTGVVAVVASEELAAPVVWYYFNLVLGPRS